MEDLKPNDRRAKNAMSLAWALLVMECVVIVFGILSLSVFNENMVYEHDETLDMLYNLFVFVDVFVSFVYFIVNILSFIFFVMWLRRAYFNLHQKVDTLSYGDGWAVGSWFVPIMNLWRPYAIVKELYAETNNLFSQNLHTCNLEVKKAHFGLWWALWLITGFISQISYRVVLDERSDGLDIVLTIITSAIGIPLALLFLCIIKNYSEVEPELMDISDDVYGLQTETVEAEYKQKNI